MRQQTLSHRLEYHLALILPLRDQRRKPPNPLEYQLALILPLRDQRRKPPNPSNPLRSSEPDQRVSTRCRRHEASPYNTTA